MSTITYVEEGSKTTGTQLNENKKQILLIGDSIREGYCEYTKNELSDIADVYYPEENCRSSQYIITRLRFYITLCNPETVDLLLFNCGHWDVAHWSGTKYSLTSHKDYKKNIGLIVDIAKQLFPKAKIVFATTTPMNPDVKDNKDYTNPRTTKEIIKYNSIAKKVCKKLNLPIIDLFDFTKDFDASAYKDYCHYTDEKKEVMGKYVASEITKLL